MPTNVKTGVILFAHGSRIEPANDSVRAVAGEVAQKSGFDMVEAAFLDLAKPDLREAVGRMVSHGVTRVLVVPYFLTLGTHLQRDLPRIVEEIAATHRDLEILITDPLDGHHTLSQIVLDRAAEKIGQHERNNREKRPG